MTKATTANEAAFPRPFDVTEHPGLTKREYAAIHLAAAMIVTPHMLNGLMDRSVHSVNALAIEAADALLAELAKS